MLTIMTCFRLFYEILELSYHRSKYFTEIMNFAELSLYVLTLIYVWGDTIQNGDQRCGDFDDPLYPYQMIKSPGQNVCGAFAVLLAWFVLLLYMRQFPKLGIYVMMFQQVLLTFIEVFFMFMIMIIAFALMFSMLMGNKIQCVWRNTKRPLKLP